MNAKADTSVTASGAGGQIPYFADPSLRQRLDLLHHLVEYADLLLVVKGPDGAGKTALLDQLVGTSPDNWLICRVDATPLTTREQLVSQLARQIGLEASDFSAGSPGQALVDRLDALQQGGRIVLLAVDDAEALAAQLMELIARLHDLTGKGGKLLRIVLFAESGLDEVLTSPALKPLAQRITHTLDVPPFARQQSRAFLEHVLSHRGSGIDLPLPEETVLDAHERSEGLPGRLVNLADTLVEAEPAEAEQEQAKVVSKWPTPHPRYWLGGAVILLALVALVFQDAINSLFESEEPPAVRADGAGRTELPLPPEGTVERPRVDRPSPSAIGRLPRVETGVPGNSTVPSTDAPRAETGPPSGVVARPAPPSPREPVGETEPPPVVSATATEAEPEPSEQPPEIREPPEAPGKPVAVAEAPLLPGVEGAAWIESRPPARFTLQLLGVREIGALAEFVEDHGLSNRASVFATRFKGAPWYVLLYGSFADRAEAEKARDDLTKRLPNVQPWPRTFGSVQEQLQGQR